MEQTDLNPCATELGGKALGEALLTPTRIYVKPVLALLEKVERPRRSPTSPAAASMKTSPGCMPEGLTRQHSTRTACKSCPSSTCIAKAGSIPERDMFNTFNMGVGMSVVRCRQSEADEALRMPSKTPAKTAVRHGRDRDRRRG